MKHLAEKRMKLKVGDMAYIPSETYIYQYNNQDSSTAQRYERLKEPKSLLVIGEDARSYEILMLGASWYVNKRDAYGINKEIRSDNKIN